VSTPLPSNKLLLICDESAKTAMQSATKMMTVICNTRLTIGNPPWPIARRCDSALPTSCSMGRKNPGISANAMNHMATIGLKPSWPSACWPILKNTYAETPAMNSPIPTETVPSGRALFELAVLFGGWFSVGDKPS